MPTNSPPYRGLDQVYDDVEHQATMDYINSTSFTTPTTDWVEERINIIGQNGNTGCHYAHSVEYYPPGVHETKPKENYYQVGGIEVIDYIKAKLTPEQYLGYLLGNIYKYSGRMQYKGEYYKDVRKLLEYTTWLKELNANNS